MFISAAGLLGSLFSFLQFLSSPILGATSDVIGRKPVLLFTMVIQCHFVCTCVCECTSCVGGRVGILCTVGFLIQFWSVCSGTYSGRSVQGKCQFEYSYCH